MSGYQALNSPAPPAYMAEEPGYSPGIDSPQPASTAPYVAAPDLTSSSYPGGAHHDHHAYSTNTVALVQQPASIGGGLTPLSRYSQLAQCQHCGYQGVTIVK
jgi:hypothetical protein